MDTSACHLKHKSMAKHRSHIVRPVLAENNSKLQNRFDFVFSEDIRDWMFPRNTDGRKRRKEFEKGRV